ncbi:hypothetical protein [Glycomyces sp. NPDC047010]|uniref:hypothetical protein n=1 Tax=Glycomyces sp. NPDC047010 TaxID=3155023 RepID=UPI0033D590DF
MRRYLIALLLCLTALTAAACGDDADDGGVASVDGDASESADDGGGDGEDLSGFEEALAYSQCMRDNGVTDFPDPEQNGDGGISLGLPEGIDPDDETFKAAEEACEDQMPGPDENATIDPELYEALLAYSECMRENGVPGFPDPEPNGGIMMNGDELGVDPQGQEMKDAQAACQDLAPEGPGASNDSGDE